MSAMIARIVSYIQTPLAVRVLTAGFLPVGLAAPNLAPARSVIAGVGAAFLGGAR